jgi:hypothetical protein
MSKSSESLKCFGTGVRNQTCLDEETESHLKSENASYNSVQNNFFLCLILKKAKVCLRTGCLGEPLDLRGRKQREARDNCTVELHQLHCSQNIIRKIEGERWKCRAARSGDM